ncbi:MAG: dihydroneopterin aldolase [Chloroflexi bacterium]|nr:dihydroneopterin aldolase [Chloroflexota bacterium]
MLEYAAERGGPVATQDCICIEGMIFYGFHGVRPEERTLGQRFVVDLAIFRDLAPAARSDALADTVHYARLHDLAREVVEGPPCQLIETVAERLAARVLDAFGGRVWVRVAKPQAPIRGAVTATTAVEITRQAPRRRRKDAGT